jgi:integral membrane protein (TIGR00529 family)
MALVKLSILLLLMVILIIRKLKVGYVLLLATFFTEVLFYINPVKFFEAILKSTVEPKTIDIMVIIFSILVLSNFMQDKKVLSKLIDGLKSFIKNKKILAASLPAFIGLLPMPGGALFSAPMADEALKNEDLTPEEKTYVNYWFRHIWEYIFPLYPGIILTSGLLNISHKTLFFLHLPFTILMLIIGYFVVFYGKSFEKSDRKISVKKSVENIIKGIFPVFLIIVLAIVFNINTGLSIVISLAVSFVLYKVSLKEAAGFIKKGFKMDMLLMVLGIFYFKKAIEVTGAISLLPSIFSGHDMVLFLLFFLPFITGLLTGITLAYVGITFPILSTYLIAANGHVNLSFEMVAYVSGFLGVLLSPVHLCLLLTNEYFKSDLKLVYKYLIKSGIVLTIFIFVIYFVRTNIL